MFQISVREVCLDENPLGESAKEREEKLKPKWEPAMLQYSTVRGKGVQKGGGMVIFVIEIHDQYKTG